MIKSRLKVGIDVPWVTSWSDEEILGVRPCPSIDGRLAICQAERPGEGKPNYSRNHHRRQRESIRKMLCPICGQPTEAGDRWTQTATPVAAGALRAKGLRAKGLRAKGLGAALPPVVPDHQVVLDAGAIAPCAERALAHCPHLGAQSDQTLRPFPERWTTFPLTIEATPPGRASPRADRGDQLHPALRRHRRGAARLAAEAAGGRPAVTDNFRYVIKTFSCARNLRSIVKFERTIRGASDNIERTLPNI